LHFTLFHDEDARSNNPQVIHPFSAWIVGDALRQGLRTYGARKDFPGSRHSLLASVFYFFLATSVSVFWRIYVHIHIHTYLSA